jgi:hypothetical protein
VYKGTAGGCTYGTTNAPIWKLPDDAEHLVERWRRSLGKEGAEVETLIHPDPWLDNLLMHIFCLRYHFYVKPFLEVIIQLDHDNELTNYSTKLLMAQSYQTIIRLKRSIFVRLRIREYTGSHYDFSFFACLSVPHQVIGVTTNAWR